MNQSFHTENRRKLSAHMADGEVMLFFSGESVRKTADENFPFFTNRNFLYLTGVKQEGSALLLEKKNGIVQERLFAAKPDFAQEIWHGRRFTEIELNQLSGVERIEDIANLTGH